MVARTLLEDLGHRVQVVETGVEAVAAVAGEPFDLVLMDLRMPAMGGCDASALIRQGGAADKLVSDRDVFICAMTANATPQEREKTRKVGMNDFLTKPVREHELHALLQRVIDFQLERGIRLVPALQLQDLDLAQLDHLLGPVDAYPKPAQTPVSVLPPESRNVAGRQAALRAVFRQDVQTYLGRLDGFVRESNWGEVREIAHAVCGAAAALKLDGLRGVAAELENACRDALSQQCVVSEKQMRGLMVDFLKENAV